MFACIPHPQSEMIHFISCLFIDRLAQKTTESLPQSYKKEINMKGEASIKNPPKQVDFVTLLRVMKQCLGVHTVRLQFIAAGGAADSDSQ